MLGTRFTFFSTHAFAQFFSSRFLCLFTGSTAYWSYRSAAGHAAVITDAAHNSRAFFLLGDTLPPSYSLPWPHPVVIRHQAVSFVAHARTPTARVSNLPTYFLPTAIPSEAHFDSRHPLLPKIESSSPYWSGTSVSQAPSLLVGTTFGATTTRSRRKNCRNESKEQDDKESNMLLAPLFTDAGHKSKSI